MHYTHQQIVGISTVTAAAILSTDPRDPHGTAPGKILPVNYQKLTAPIDKQNIPLKLRQEHSSQNYKYAPFNKNGDLNEG